MKWLSPLSLMFLFCLTSISLHAQQTPNGWAYEVERAGKGAALTVEQGALTHNQLIDAQGNILVSTYQIGVPDYQLISELSPSLQQALSVMKEGGKYKFVIPIEEFKAAAKSSGADRLSGQHVIWEMELLKILPPKPDGAREIMQTAKQDGLEAAYTQYQKLINSGTVYFGEWETNQVGYFFLQNGEKEKAIKVLAYNTKLHPDSANAHDSLAEAYYAADMKEEAKIHYQKSLAINPNNSNAKKMLDKM